MPKDYGKEMMQEEAQRQDRIDQATQTIRAILYGGKGREVAKAYKPGAIYTDPSGDRIRLGGSDAEGHFVTLAGLKKMIGQGKVFSAKKYDPQFNNAYFNKLQTSYKDYMNPQLEKQYGDADEALTFALARQGLLGQNSSVRAKEQSDLLEKMRIQKRTVIDKAKDVANSQRQAVSGLESNLIAMAQASANPATAASQAGMQAKALTTPPSFSPLEMVFTDATSALATQAELERRKQAAFDMGISNIVGGGSSQTITA